MKRLQLVWLVAALVLMALMVACAKSERPTTPSSSTAGAVTPEEARAIAKEAYTYGFPMVDSYRVQYSYFVDRQNPEFKASWNQIVNTPRVFTPADTAIQTPNSETHPIPS